MMEKTELKQKWMEGYEIVFTDDEEQETDKTISDFGKYLDSVKTGAFTEGEVFKGRVISVGSDYVTIDIGYKQEGLVSIKEFQSHDGSLKVKEGDEIEVYLDKLESSLGNLVLSKDKAEIIKAWDRISEACESGQTLEGTVISKVKGGLSVDIGVKAFLPGSQIDIRPNRHLDKYIGKTMQFKVIKFNKKRGNIVLSRRAVLQEERGKMRSEILDQLQEGIIVKGTVKNITEYGAFVDLGGVDGLLHVTDMSWGRVKHPESVLTVGEELDVKILKFDPEKERVSLGLKQTQESPWKTAKEKYLPGQKIEGEIVLVKDYGIFVVLDDGLEGLIHVSEVSWTEKMKNPTKHFHPGNKLQAQVLDVDVENKRISLGLKQLTPNPWDDIVKKYKQGQIVKGKAKSIVEFGMFVDLGEKVDALIDMSDFSWVKKNVDLSREFKTGQEIEAVVLDVDKEEKKFSLGIKQLKEDPWEKVEERTPVGTLLEGVVVRMADFGLFVKLEDGIEGLVHVSELAEERVEDPDSLFKKGDKVKTMIIAIDKDAKKISLSIKAATKREQDETLESVQAKEVKTATFAEKLKNFTFGKK